MYNAVVGITGEYELYRWNAKAPKGASPEAAAAAAAHRVLRPTSVRRDRRRPRCQLAASLALVPDGVPRTRAFATASAPQTDLIALRANDGRGAAVTVPAGDRGRRLAADPAGDAPFLVPWWRDRSPPDQLASQFDPGDPPRSERRPTGPSSRRSATTAPSIRAPQPEQTLTARFLADIPIGPLQAALRDRRHVAVSISAIARACSPPST